MCKEIEVSDFHTSRRRNPRSLTEFFYIASLYLPGTRQGAIRVAPTWLYTRLERRGEEGVVWEKGDISCLMEGSHNGALEDARRVRH